MTSAPLPSPEAQLLGTNHILLPLPRPDDSNRVDGFCGVVADLAAGLPGLRGKSVWLSGDLSAAPSPDLRDAASVRVIRERSRGYAGSPWPLAELAQVPLDVHGVGVYVRRFFDPEVDYFERIQSEHAFQSLRESTKPGTAHRTGIYLTPVRQEGEALHFRLLRCSTNLSGPTENFRATDRHIVDALNQEAALLFGGAAPLNHVLAQVYHNTPASAEKKQAKARISSHADKTKDMPRNGIMAFCTFYARGGAPGWESDERGLTRLRFRLKEVKQQGLDSALPAEFVVTLHPNSVFFMPLSTNRLYTHEILPSVLDAGRAPTRLGYVVRCSKTEAVHEAGRTWIARGEGRVALEEPTPEGMDDLRRVYAEENRTQALIDYGDRFRFSMNAGDYLAPACEPADEFRAYTLRTPDGLFAELLASARWEAAGKGRRGAVLVAVDAARGVPIVRTTTAYALPAQAFQPVHARLERQIRAAASLARPFNNALFEVYTGEAKTMGAHSDQGLDLEEGSEIALFSCYEHPVTGAPPRVLLVESKEPGGPSFALPLHPNRVVVFSTDTNRRFRHRIVLDPAYRGPENTWIGLTFRTAKTFVRFPGGEATLADGTPLRLAGEGERAEFFQLRRRENQEAQFSYPPIAYTLSASDRLPVAEGPPTAPGQAG